MPETHFDYSIERQRHEGFVGREQMLAELDRLLIEHSVDRWVVITGGPGMGKSALLAAWLDRREAMHEVVPHHFIRRGHYGWDEPATIVRSLAAQIEARYPAQRDPGARPESRLVDLLARVSARELRPHGGRMVLVVDGLDEYDAPPAAYDPLGGFLPHALSPGIRVLCASRPRHPYLEALGARDGELTRLDLDAPSAARDNEATVRAFWGRAAATLGLEDRFVAEAVARAGGNLQYAVTLQRHLAGVAPEQRRVEILPHGLQSLLAMLWRRVAHHAVAVRGLGILCAARESLSLDELGAVAGWDDHASREAFMTSARELLVETRRDDGTAEYRLHHDAIRAHIMEQLGAAAVRAHHAALAQRLAAWPAPLGATRRYALRHALVHRSEAGDGAGVGRVARDFGFLEAKCRELGVDELEADIARAAASCHARGDRALARDLDDLVRALAHESHWLRAEPGALAGQLWNRLRRTGWTAEALAARVVLPADGAAFLRVRHVISRESPALVRSLVGHTGWVTQCAVSPDGRRVVSSAFDSALRVWDIDTGRVVAVLRCPDWPSGRCVVTADSRRVIQAVRKTIRVWDIDTGRAIAAFDRNIELTICGAIPDDRLVVLPSGGKTIEVWDLATGRVIAAFEHDDVHSCEVTPDGSRLISAANDQTLVVWDLEARRAVTRLEGLGGRVCAVTRDGQRAILTSFHHALEVWDLATSQVVATLAGHTGPVRSCVVTPDGRRAVSASFDQTLKLWDLGTGQLVATFEGHGGDIQDCAVTPDGRRAISASFDETLKIWDLDVDPAAARREGHAMWVSGGAITADHRRMISTSKDGTLKIWDLASGRLTATLAGHARWVTGCAVTPEGRRVISASHDATLKIWDLDTGLPVATLEGHSGGVTSCAVTPDGRRAISSSADATLRVWDLDSAQLVATLRGHADKVHGCVVTPDGRRAVSASEDQTLKVWDLDDYRLLATLRGHTGRVGCCSITPDGRHVVSGATDWTLRVWDLEAGQLVATLHGHAAYVNSCAVMPDGRHVVSAAMDRTLKVWDLVTGSCIATHRGDTSIEVVVAHPTSICAGDRAGRLLCLDWPIRQAPVAEDRSLSAPHRPGRPRHVILFLAANPDGTSRLALDEECAAIERELRTTAHRDDFEFQSKWAVTVDDLMRYLDELKPSIIQFSGHGSDHDRAGATPRATHRDVAADLDARCGIYLHDEDRRPWLVTPRALADMIRSTAAAARVVVLNACYSAAQAEALRDVVDVVVGMTGAIRDDAARWFATAFYRALGNRRPVGNAVDQAVAALAARHVLEDGLVRCVTRDGVDAHRLVLETPLAAPAG